MLGIKPSSLIVPEKHAKKLMRQKGEQPRNPIDSGAIQQLIHRLHWKYAKTYPDAPHEYILESWAPDVFAYFREKLTTEFIEEELALRGRTNSYRYYYPGDGYRYWIIQEVLNRCRADSTKGGNDQCLPRTEQTTNSLHMYIRPNDF